MGAFAGALPLPVLMAVILLLAPGAPLLPTNPKMEEGGCIPIVGEVVFQRARSFTSVPE